MNILLGERLSVDTGNNDLIGFNPGVGHGFNCAKGTGIVDADDDIKFDAIFDELADRFFAEFAGRAFVTSNDGGIGGKFEHPVYQPVGAGDNISAIRVIQDNDIGFTAFFISDNFASKTPRF